MSSSSSDFTHLSDHAQSHHQHPPPATAASSSRYATKSPKKGVGNEDDDLEGYGESLTPPDASINPHHHCFPNDGPAPNPFACSHADDAASITAAADCPAHHHDPSQIKRIPASSPKSLSNPRWKRVVLKISGSVLIGSGAQNVDPEVLTVIAGEIAMAKHVGVEVAVVVGGRNFFCSESWVAATRINRDKLHEIGMVASAMNSMMLQDLLERIGVQARVQTGFEMQEIFEPYRRQRAIRHLEKGRVVIFGGIRAETGNSTFTTDTAAAWRASEINADAVLKGTNVDGAFEHISFGDMVSRGLIEMDPTAITFCGEKNIPILIFNLLEHGNFSRALTGDQVGTLID